MPLLITYDAAPCEAFGRILGERPAWPHYLLKAGTLPAPSDDELMKAILATDVVVVGLSSFKTADFEMKVCQLAKDIGRKLVFFADTFGEWQREWFAPWRDYVSLVCVVTPSEIAGAEAMFANARVVATGNPSWEAFHEAGDRVAARAVMCVRDEDIVFISGTKDFGVNTEMLGAALSISRRPRVVLSLHPGDKTPLSQYEHFVVQATATESEESANCLLLPKSVMPGDKAVYGADVVLTYNAASVAMRAIAQQIPVVVLRTPLALARLLEESGTDVNPLLPQAALHGGKSAATLSRAVNEVLDQETSVAGGQLEFFPPIAEGAYTTALIQAIESLVQ